MQRHEAEVVFAAVRKFFTSRGIDVPDGEWVFRDHTHEGLSPGAWSLACEGQLYDWPRLFIDDPASAAFPAGVFIEPIAGYALGIYDNPEGTTVRNESPLHSGNMERESGQREVFWDRWEVHCLARWYELDKDTTVKVVVFLADVTGFNRDPDRTASDFYRYAVEVHRDEEMIAETAGMLDPTRLVPSIGGETVELLAWETALGHAERLLMGKGLA